MYFSLINAHPDRTRAAAHQRMNDPYNDHQWLWNWFPAAPNTARDFLFRRADDAQGARYFVVSSRPPLATQGDWVAHSRNYAPQVKAGDVLHFDLRANPSVRISQAGKSKRHDVVMQAKMTLLRARGLAHWKQWTSADRPSDGQLVHQHCKQWLVDRAARNGFALVENALQVDGYQQHEHHGHNGKALALSTVDFSGELEVIDPVAFTQALQSGIGSAKAFGCGLLLVKRSI